MRLVWNIIAYSATAELGQLQKHNKNKTAEMKRIFGRGSGGGGDSGIGVCISC